MSIKKLTVVISQTQGKNPSRQQLEEELAAQLLLDPSVEVSLVPHLNDMHAEHSGLLFLRSVSTDLIVLNWMYSRAAFWILDRQGVKGHFGKTLLTGAEENSSEDLSTSSNQDQEEHSDETSDNNGIGALEVPNRKVFCIDLRNQSDPQEYLDEIKRIQSECSQQTVDLMSWVQGSPQPEQLDRYLNPQPNGKPKPNQEGSKIPESLGNGEASTMSGSLGINLLGGSDQQNTNHSPADEKVKRRWFPVIDYSRCTNCMECIDFCLFGVYGVDSLDRILVEEQDNCKKGCPACSRVCPANAIIFPLHKESGIAGAEGEVAGLKINLSALFGGVDAIDLAVAERDQELVEDGREAVGKSVGLRTRHSSHTTITQDEETKLDELMEEMDQLDL